MHPSLFFFLLFLAGTVVNCSAQEDISPRQSPIQQAVDRLANDPALVQGELAFYAIDLDSGEVIADWRGSKTMVPASSLKVLTTATALDLLGPEHTFTTQIAYQGQLDTLDDADSTVVLDGSLIIIGGADPALGSRYFEEHYKGFLQRWAAAIDSFGIDSIHGQVIADAGALDRQMIPSTWIWGDMGNYYGAGPSGLSIYDNILEFTFKTGPAAGRPARIVKTSPKIPGLEIENHVVGAEINSDQCYLFGPPYQPYRLATGQIPRARNNFVVKGSIPDPPLLAAQEFDRVLRKAGIGIHGDPTTMRVAGPIPTKDRQVIFEQKSPTLAELVKETNMRSLNLFCEHYLRFIGGQKGAAPNNDEGTRIFEEFWAQNGMDAQGLVLNDGSGLSRANAISTKQLVQVLAHVNKSEYKKVFLASLPVAGRSGSLKGLCKGTAAEGNLRAKSGYMSRVRSYTGFVTSSTGRNFAFSMIANNYTCSAREMKLKLQRLMVALARTP